METTNAVIILKGQPGSPGIGFGVLQFYRRHQHPVLRSHTDDIQAEIIRFENARAQAVAELAQLAVDTTYKLGKENSLLFEIHQMMLEDMDYHGSITRMIREEGVVAEYAVHKTAVRLSRVFSQMEDEYLSGRAADVQDVSRRVLQILSGRKPPRQHGIGRRMLILAADEFAPSEMAAFDRETVMGLAVQEGSPSSHSAIFARVLGIPSVITLGGMLNEEHEGKQVAVDGSEGLVYISPDAANLTALLRRQDEYRRRRWFADPDATTGGGTRAEV